MKLAILLTGHIRSFKKNYDSFVKYIIEPHDTDIFIHTWDLYNGVSGNHPKLLPEETEKIDIEFLKKLNPKELIIEKWEDVEPEIKWSDEYFTKKQSYDTPIITLSLFRKMYLCNELKKKYEKENNFKYDVVLRTRPDLLYSRNFIDESDDFENIIYTPVYCSFNIISELTAYSSSENMDIYCDVYNNLKKIYNITQCEFNAHKLLKNYLDHLNLKFVIQCTDIKFNKYPQ